MLALVFLACGKLQLIVQHLDLLQLVTNLSVFLHLLLLMYFGEGGKFLLDQLQRYHLQALLVREMGLVDSLVVE